MTLPDERSRAIRNARRFLRSLLDPKKTPRVPRAVRREAYHCLRHYPGEYDMLRALSGRYPEIFGKIPPDDEEY